MPTEIRKRVIWKNFKSPTDWLALFIATGGGSGLIPGAPGTWGSIAAMPFAYWLNLQTLEIRVAVFMAVFVAGIWAASRFDSLNQTGDNQHIVIDEVLGTWIAAWFAGSELKSLIIATVLFRIFDITKPPPVRWVDRWSKTAAKKTGNYWIGGFGVIMDDVVAGFQALLVFWVLVKANWI